MADCARPCAHTRGYSQSVTLAHALILTRHDALVFVRAGARAHPHPPTHTHTHNRYVHTGNVDRLAVSGHPSQGSLFSISSTPPDRSTTVMGGNGWDTFVVTDQSSLTSILAVQGGGGVNSVSSTIRADAGDNARVIVSKDVISLTRARGGGGSTTNHSVLLSSIGVRVVNIITDPVSATTFHTHTHMRAHTHTHTYLLIRSHTRTHARVIFTETLTCVVHVVVVPF